MIRLHHRRFVAPGFLPPLLLVLAFALVGCSGANSAMLENYLADNAAALDIPASSDTTPNTFIVEPGTPAKSIGANLRAAGLIADDRLFEAYVRVNDLGNRLQAGSFSLSPNMTLVEIVAALQHARIPGRTITIREGWRFEQTADWLAATDQFSDTVGGVSAQAEAYRSAAGTSVRQQVGASAPNADVTGSAAITGAPSIESPNAESLNTQSLNTEDYPWLPAEGTLEGYLFPDTYELPIENPSGVELVARQLDTFAARVLPLYSAAVAEGRTTLTLHEVITLASIVEREAVVPAERPAIARVYLNRIENDMRLEADPTVQYAMGYQPDSGQWWKTPVSLAEYGGVLSPYNTYLNTGLPLGPIASPGISSIEAVLDPDEHNYLYFVALPDGSGAHVFALRSYPPTSARMLSSSCWKVSSGSAPGMMRPPSP